jgi:hypothetical protein
MVERSDDPPFSVDADVPYLEGPEPRVQPFNRSVEKLIQGEIERFRPQEGMAVPESSLDITFQIRFAREGLISLLFEVFRVHVGAAHPVSHSRVLNFDLRQGKPLSLSSLFRPESGYLRAIAVYAMNELEGQAALQPYTDRAWLEKGAGPRMENYRNWTLTPEGLEITFDPYQVAAYVAGSQTVLIPWEILKGLIRPGLPARNR